MISSMSVDGEHSMAELQGDNSNLDRASEECNNHPVSIQKELKWNSEQIIALLNGMINLKPAG